MRILRKRENAADQGTGALEPPRGHGRRGVEGQKPRFLCAEKRDPLTRFYYTKGEDMATSETGEAKIMATDEGLSK